MKVKDASGNVLFIILIAVVLFAALGYVATQTGRSSGNIGRERAMIMANDVLSYAHAIEEAAHRILYSGTEYARLSFENTAVSGYEHSPATPATNRVFNGAGGGLDYVPPRTEWLDSSMSAYANYGQWYFPRTVCINDVGTGSGYTCHTSAAHTELLVVMPYIQKEICVAINEKLGITNPSGSPPANAFCVWAYPSMPKYVGAFGIDESIDAPELLGKKTGCYMMDTCPGFPVSYFFYHVIAAR